MEEKVKGEKRGDQHERRREYRGERKNHQYECCRKSSVT